MNEDGINRQGWFAISLGAVFMIGLVFVLIGGDEEIQTDDDQTPTRPSNQAQNAPVRLNPQQAQEKTRDLNLIQNLIQQGLPSIERDKPEIISDRNAILRTITAALSQTVETVGNLTKTVVSKVLPSDAPEDDLPPTTEPLIQNPTSNTVNPGDLIQEDEIASPIELKLIEGANPLTID